MKRLICWIFGHLWVNTGKFPDLRLHGCTHYATAHTKCHRCGVRHQLRCSRQGGLVGGVNA